MNKEKLLDIIAEFTSVKPENMEGNMDFVDDLGIDSLDLAQIIISAESEFDVELDDEAIENIKTVGDALEMLRNKLD